MSEMKIKLSRRGLLSALGDRLTAQNLNAKGIPLYRLEILPNVSDEQMDKMKPRISPKCRITLQGDTVYAETASFTEPFELFERVSPALYIFNQFNGMQTMREITEKVSLKLDLSREESRQAVREMFLKLCEVRVCEPDNNFLMDKHD